MLESGKHPPGIETAELPELENNSELLQSPFWGRFKACFGWRSYGFKLHYSHSEKLILVLYRKLGLGLGLAYIPYPDLPLPGTGREALLAGLSKALAPLLPRDTRFIRYDLAWSACDPDLRPGLEPGRGLFKAPLDIQPPSTVILDITKPEGEILAGMKSKTRYNIRLAGRKGVEVLETGADGLETWYQLYRETAARDRIVLHAFEYYQQLFECAGRAGGPVIRLLLARIDAEIVAGIIVVMYRQRAVYLYGASGDRKRNYMPNHALQWRAIQLARQAGCTTYDFFGIPEKEDPSHPMQGLYRFKTGFGGRIVHRCGCYDFALAGLWYSGYKLAEGLRGFYYKRVRKRFG